MKANNNLNLIGHLAKDAKIHDFENGNKQMELVLGIDTSYTPKNGEKVERVDWITCRKDFATEDQANILTKGFKVSLNGRLRNRNYDNKDGQTIYETYVEVNDLQFLTPKSN